MPDGDTIDLADIIEELKPYIPGLVKTIGMAGEASTDAAGKVTPGDVKAASIGLDLVVKHLSGQGSTRLEQLLKEFKAADDSPAEGLDRSDDTDEEAT